MDIRDKLDKISTGINIYNSSFERYSILHMGFLEIGVKYDAYRVFVNKENKIVVRLDIPKKDRKFFLGSDCLEYPSDTSINDSYKDIVDSILKINRDIGNLILSKGCRASGYWKYFPKLVWWL